MPETGTAPPARTAPDNHHAPSTNGRGRERVGEVQRARLLTAMVEICAERGARNATVTRVVSRSGVSRRTFYDQFTDREDCFLAAFDQTVQRIATVVIPAYRQPSTWREQTRAGLKAMLEYLDAEPDAGRLLIVEALAAGPKTLERRKSVLAHVIKAIDQGHKEGGARGSLPLTAEGLTGCVFSLIHERLLGDSNPLIDLLNPLMSMIVLPYLGPDAAHKELEQQVPSTTPPNTRRKASSEALRDLDLRLTYRTIRVLTAVAEHTSASNREVADAADIRDQGQISKLLARLNHLGLIENTAQTPTKGEPNAWKLTTPGTEILTTITT